MQYQLMVQLYRLKYKGTIRKKLVNIVKLNNLLPESQQYPVKDKVMIRLLDGELHHDIEPSVVFPCARKWIRPAGSGTLLLYPYVRSIYFKNGFFIRIGLFQ